MSVITLFGSILYFSEQKEKDYKGGLSSVTNQPAEAFYSYYNKSTQIKETHHKDLHF